MDDFQKEVVLTALKKMFQDSSFNICTIDRCLKISGAIPTAKDYDSLSALHCISWKDMSLDLRTAVFKKTINIFSQEGFDLSVLEMAFNKERNVFELKQPKKKIFGLLGG